MVRYRLKRAINEGVRLIDTAYSHGCEKVVGEVLKNCWDVGYKREDFFIISKLPPIANKKNKVLNFLCKSLENLGLLQLDLYLIESPVGLTGKDDEDVDPKDEEGNSILDYSTDLYELWQGMENVKEMGLARHIGVCNFNMNQITKIYEESKIKPGFTMMDINAYNQRSAQVSWMKQNNIEPLAIMPFGAPNYISRPGYPQLPLHWRVKEMSNKYKVPPETILLKYVVQHDVTTLFQTNSRSKISQILGTFSCFELTGPDILYLDELDQEGLGQMRDFLEYKGCNKHPEFPFMT